MALEIGQFGHKSLVECSLHQVATWNSAAHILETFMRANKVDIDGPYLPNQLFF